MTDRSQWRWRHRDALAVVATPERVVVLDLDALAERVSPVALVGTGRAIWGLLDGRIDESELVAQLASDFGVQGEDILEQVRAFLDSLADQGLLTREAPRAV